MVLAVPGRDREQYPGIEFANGTFQSQIANLEGKLMIELFDQDSLVLDFYFSPHFRDLHCSYSALTKHIPEAMGLLFRGDIGTVQFSICNTNCNGHESLVTNGECVNIIM